MNEKRIGAVILAAGAASRFGSDKLVALHKGRPLLQFALTAATLSRAEAISLVVQPHKLDVYRPLVRAFGDRIVLAAAPRSQCGLAFSLRAGLASLPQAVRGVVILLADMPLVDASLTNALIDCYSEGDYAVVPEHGDRWGNPVLLSRAATADVQGLEGDSGARELLRANASRVRLLAWDSHCLIDIDTKQDLASLTSCGSERD